MVVKGKLLPLLIKLKKLYNSETDAQLQIIYSKMALMEVSGWIEESVDLIVEKCVTKKISNQSNIKHFEESKKRVNQFKYSHFRIILCLAIGLVKFEKLEKQLGPTIHANLESTLDSLAKLRNDNAHISTIGVLTTIPSPSLLTRDFTNVYKGLREVEKAIKKLK